MINSRACLVVLSVLCVCSVFAQVAPTFTVEVGSFPWHDRVNQWPISQIPDKYVSDKPFEYDVQKRVPDVAKSRNVLGFEARTSLDESLDEVIPWIKKEIELGGI